MFIWYLFLQDGNIKPCFMRETTWKMHDIIKKRDIDKLKNLFELAYNNVKDNCPMQIIDIEDF